MAAKEKRTQRRARREHVCYICGRPIRAGLEYIAYTRQDADTGVWASFKRHIHCDALMRKYARETSVKIDDVSVDDMQEYMDFLCDTECIAGMRKQCRNDQFSCGPIIHALRGLPGCMAAKKSAEEHGR